MGVVFLFCSISFFCFFFTFSFSSNKLLVTCNFKAIAFLAFSFFLSFFFFPLFLPFLSPSTPLFNNSILFSFSFSTSFKASSIVKISFVSVFGASDSSFNIHSLGF